MSVSYITGTIEHDDGTTSQFTIGPDKGWQQFGAVREVLGRNVDLMEALADAAYEFMEQED